MSKKCLTSYDFDGVITASKSYTPTPNKDVIITGRCLDECSVVYAMLAGYGIKNVPVYFNPIYYSQRGDKSVRSRVLSGIHKGCTLARLARHNIVTHYDDDILQIRVARLFTLFSDVGYVLVENEELNFKGREYENF